MSWTEIDAENGRKWEREDDFAIVTVRETTSGEWAVVLDQLEQAPDGQRYEHEIVESEDEALDLAAEWRDRFDVEAE